MNKRTSDAAKKTVTQKQIADLAQVSQATVSRVLTSDDTVEPAKAERVRDVMRKLNYRPDVAARSLRNRQSGLVGLVVKRTAGDLQEDPFFSTLTSEIVQRLAGTPYHLCLEIASETTQNGIYDDLLRTRRVDGLILVESEARDRRIHRLQHDHFPFVLIGNPSLSTEPPSAEVVWSVDNDNVAAAFIATEHLIASGAKKLAFLAGPQNVTVCEDRILGFNQAAQKHGLAPVVIHSDFGLNPAKDAACTLLNDANTRPDSLLVMDDLMAMGVVQAARACKLTIPNQLRIASFNDSNLCNVVDGGLTSVNLNLGEIVQQSISLLLALIEGDIRPARPKRVIVPSNLSVRGSSVIAEEAMA